MIASRPALFARQGVVVATWRWYRGRRLGPYWRLAYREAGRQCSVYLGRMGEGVRRVRGVLARLQRGLRSRRAVRRLTRRVRASLRAHLAEFDRRLAELGLWRKGFEVRGGWSRALEQRFLRAAAGDKAARVALIEVPRPGDELHPPELNGAPCLVGHLSREREWFVSPVELRLDDGIVVEVVPSEGMASGDPASKAAELP